MKRAQRTTATAAAGMTKSLAGVKAGITGFAAALSVGLIAEAIKKSLDYAGSLAEVSKTLGVTTKDLQTFRFAATQSGVSQDELEVGLRRLTVTMGKAQLGSKAQADAFKAIGISVDQLKGKTTGDVFRLLSDGLSKVKDRSQRAAIEMILMGRSGSTLDNLLAPGAKRLNELADAAQRLGIVLSDSQIQGAEDTAHKLEAVKEVLTAQIAGVVAQNAASIVTLAQSLSTLTVEIIKFLNSNPQTAFAIMGAIAGSRLGVPGAAAGAVAGFIAGDMIGRSADDANTDLNFRKQKLHQARDELLARRASETHVGSIVTFRRGSRTSGATVADAEKEFLKQIDLTNRAAAAHIAGNANRVTTPTGDLPKFLASPGPKAKKAPRDRSEDTLFQFDQEQRRADTDILRAKQDLSHSTAERADISLKILDIETEARDAELDNQVHRAQQDYAEGRITKSALDEVTAQAAILKAKNHQVSNLEAQSIIEDRDEQLRRETNAISQHEYEIRSDILQKQSNLAETAEERRKIELELLQIAYEQRKKALQDIVDHSKDTVEIANARADLAALNANHALDQASVLQQTRGPLENYLASLPTTAAKANEALQSLEVQGFDGLIDSVLALSDGMHSATESLLQTLKQFLLGLARLELQKMLGNALQGGGGFLGALGSLFGGSGGGLGQSLYPVSGGVDPLAALPGFASGGSGIFKGMLGRDNNVLSMNGIPFANVSYGERFTVGNDNAPQRSMNGRGNTYMTINTPDADSFRRSEGQITRSWQRRLR